MGSVDLDKKRRGRLFAYAPLFLWAVVILVLGSGAGSSAQTSRFIKPFIEFFFPDAAPDTFLMVHAFIRKAAHFVEYGLLAILAARAFRSSSIDLLRKHWPGFSLAAALLTAAADEVNQSFQSTRTGSGWDITLDLTGAVGGVILFFLFKRRQKRRETRSGD